MSTLSVFELKEKIDEQKTLKKRLDGFYQERDRLIIEVKKLKKQLIKENMDVDKMEKVSLTSVLTYINGSYDGKLEKEKMEALEVKLKYDSAEDELEMIEEKIKDIESKVEDVKKYEEEYIWLLKKKTDSIEDQDENFKKTINVITSIKNEIKEIDEAVVAGRQALNAFSSVINDLDTAKNWGIFDMLGGNFIANVGKHMKIDAARKSLSEAKGRLQIFERELKDVDVSSEVNIDMGSFMTVADFFFDNIFVDFMVQSKINDSLNKINQAYGHVKERLGSLESRKNDLHMSLEKLERNKEEILQKYF